MNRQKTKKNTTSANSSQFYINVRYQQNHSWQGSIQRLDTGENINFRSALELITLIESVIAQQSSEQHEGQQFRNWGKTKEVKNTIKNTIKNTDVLN